MVDLKRLCGLATEITNHLLLDLSHAHPSLRHEFQRDAKTVERRMQNEGISYVTKTMPQLAAAVLSALQSKVFVTPTAFKCRKGSALPRFSGGLLGLVFDERGALKEDYDPLVVGELLQVYDYAKKLSLPYTRRQEQKVLKAFVETEEDLRNLVIPDDMVIKRARATIRAIFADFDPMDVRPKHGPGSVASGEKGTEKWVFSTKYAQIHQCYPYYEYFTATRRTLICGEGLKDYKKRLTALTGEAKVLLVDKDSRGPRLISSEPCEYQFIQQGLASGIIRTLENHPISSGRVNFSSQEINQQMALEGSVRKHIATLDLKEASDRVSTQLVDLLFSDVPQLLHCLKSTRTPRTKLPDGRTVCMRKFAPMGSALCFPVMSVILFALSKAIIETNGYRDDLLRVYGDDLIVPVDVAQAVIGKLPIYGLKLNVAKSFTHGDFRESCGMDAVKGIQVTPTRWRKPWPQSRTDAASIVSLVDFANQLYAGGYWSTAGFLERKLLGFFHQVASTVSLTNSTGAIGFKRVTRSDPSQPEQRRWNCRLKRYEVMRYQLRTRLNKEEYIRNSHRLFAHLVEQFCVQRPMQTARPQFLRANWFCAQEVECALAS